MCETGDRLINKRQTSHMSLPSQNSASVPWLHRDILYKKQMLLETSCLSFLALVPSLVYVLHKHVKRGCWEPNAGLYCHGNQICLPVHSAIKSWVSWLSEGVLHVSFIISATDLQHKLSVSCVKKWKTLVSVVISECDRKKLALMTLVSFI